MGGYPYPPAVTFLFLHSLPNILRVSCTIWLWCFEGVAKQCFFLFLFPFFLVYIGVRNRSYAVEVIVHHFSGWICR